MTTQQQLEEINKMLGKLHDQNTYNIEAIQKRVRDIMIGNPAMDRQEFPEGMTDIKTPEVAKDWEILEFGNNPTIFTKQGDGSYTTPGYPYVYNEKNLFAHEPIHSVRRLSDNTVWIVGDKVMFGSYAFPVLIESFFIDNSKCMVECGDLTGEISSIATFKFPSFTTADGAQVLEGYNIWFMSPKNCPNPVVCKAIKGLNWKNCYSTKEAAEAAYKAAVLFTTADGVAVFADTRFYLLHVKDGIQGKPLDGNMTEQYVGYNDLSVTWHIARKHRIFSTRAAAEAAYEKWLYEQPVLTGNDIRNLTSRVPWGDLERIVKNKLGKS